MVCLLLTMSQNACTRMPRLYLIIDILFVAVGLKSKSKSKFAPTQWITPRSFVFFSSVAYPAYRIGLVGEQKSTLHFKILFTLNWTNSVILHLFESKNGGNWKTKKKINTKHDILNSVFVAGYSAMCAIYGGFINCVLRFMFSLQTSWCSNSISLFLHDSPVSLFTIVPALSLSLSLPSTLLQK